MTEDINKIFPTPFAAFAESRRLAMLANDDFIPVFASSNIKVLPYQIAAARFALRSQYLKGCILCDEGSLGKTYEALLIAAQKCYEGQGNILIVLPSNLVPQWQRKINEDFALPFSLWRDRENLNIKNVQDFFIENKIDTWESNFDPRNRNLFIATYDEVLQDVAEIEKIHWDLVIFDEADCLFKPENKTVIALKKAVGNAFKLLLTPTPITMSIMDIYGLIHFIDEEVLPDADYFYKRYFRKPENYPELYGWVSQFAFRTLKRQAAQYVGFTNRIPYMGYYELNKEEKQLYSLIDEYLNFPKKDAYPEMDKYRLTLLFYHLAASSPEALANMLDAPIARAKEDEKKLLSELQSYARSLSQNSKIDFLLKTLKKVFAHLKKQKENQKAIVFVDNLTTLDVLYKALSENGYNAIRYKDENALEQFKNNAEVQILITTDSSAKGLDIEYCPIVVQYDLLYNAMEMEQRICRCHRQGQKSDVLVINMLCKANVADVRILELINKRVLQFGGIFGISDEIIGNFDLSLDEVLEKRRKLDVIQGSIAETIAQNRIENEKIVENAEDALFTTFTKEIAEKVTITPQYIAERSAEISEDLWKAVIYFLIKRWPDTFIIDEKNKTINLKEGVEAPRLFYYNQKAYYSNKKYGLAPNFKPESCRITLNSILADGVMFGTECYSEGNIKVKADIEPCEISFYNVELRTSVQKTPKYNAWVKSGTWLKEYNVLRGKTASGKILSDQECREILKLPIVGYTESGEKKTYANSCIESKNAVSKIEEIEKEIILRYLSERKTQLDDDAVLLKIKASRQKALLETSLSELQQKLKELNTSLSSATDSLEELKIKKKLNLLEQELHQKEETLFLEQTKIDVDLESEIDNITDSQKLYCDFYKLFTVQINGKG